MNPRPCAREGCRGTVRKDAPASVTHCSAKCASGWRKPNGIGRTAKPATTETATVSWWLDLPPAQFYAESRRRFPVEPEGLPQRGWGVS